MRVIGSGFKSVFDIRQRNGPMMGSPRVQESVMCTRRRNMSTEGNKALVRRIFEEGVSGGDFAVIDELFSERNAVHNDQEGDGFLTPARIKPILTRIRATLPDLQVT